MTGEEGNKTVSSVKNSIEMFLHYIIEFTVFSFLHKPRDEHMSEVLAWHYKFVSDTV